mmetsp:Transcript_36061/g.66266  ORF Transcript_36061/g.66266 Transcript_36061/m.66266 type:complete len:93 (-) Transcript_36061:251-529(-)
MSQVQLLLCWIQILGISGAMASYFRAWQALAFIIFLFACCTSLILGSDSVKAQPDVEDSILLQVKTAAGTKAAQHFGARVTTQIKDCEAPGG